MLEFDDIQHILLARTPALTGRYVIRDFDALAGFLRGSGTGANSSVEIEPVAKAESGGRRFADANDVAFRRRLRPLLKREIV